MTFIRGLYLLVRGVIVGLVLLIAAIVALLVVALRRIVLPLGFVLLALLALIGLAAAIFEIDGGHGTVSLAHLASLIHLPDLRHYVGTYLHNLETQHGNTAISIGAGIAVLILGLLLLAATLIPARQRSMTLAKDSDWRLTARRRTLVQAASALAEEPGELDRVRVRARPRRRRVGGRLRVRAHRRPDADRRTVEAEVARRLAPLSDGLKLKTKVRARRTSAGRPR